MAKDRKKEDGTPFDDLLESVVDDIVATAAKLAEATFEDLGEPDLPAVTELLDRRTEAAGKQLAAESAELVERAAAVSGARRAVLHDRARLLDGFAKRGLGAVVERAGEFAIGGQVSDRKTKLGLPNLDVRLVDARDSRKGPLQRTHTGPFGHYRFRFAGDDVDALRRAGERLAVEVLGADGKPFGEAPVKADPQPGKAAVVPLPVDGERVPDAIALARVLAEGVDRQLEALESRVRVLAHREVVRFAKPARGVEPVQPGSKRRARTATKRTKKRTT